MGTIELCHHCGGNSYLFAAALTAVAFVLWKSGTWVLRPSATGSRTAQWALALVLWVLAAAVAHAAWFALG